MTSEELRTKLHERMADEQKKFREWLLGQPPSVVLDHACEYTIREDIVIEMSALELPEAQARVLLCSKPPLADVYKEWNSTETHHMEDLAKGLITYGMELMLALLNIIQGVVSSIMNAAGFGAPNKFSKTYCFTDINYMVASREDKEGEPRKACVKENKRRPFSQESEQETNLIERMYSNGTDTEGNAESIRGQPKIQQHHRDYGRDERDVPGRIAAGDGK